MSVGSIRHIETRRGARWTGAEAKRRILDEHRELRALLEETLALAEHAHSDEAEESLRLAVRALVQLFGEHLHSEESVLVPALLAAEPWGPAHAELLVEEHEGQRALLQRVFTLVSGSIDRGTLRDSASAFAELLLLDMEREEADVLALLDENDGAARDR